MITIVNSTNVNVEGLEETFNNFFKNYQITDKLYLESYNPSKHFLLRRDQVVSGIVILRMIHRQGIRSAI